MPRHQSVTGPRRGRQPDFSNQIVKHPIGIAHSPVGLLLRWGDREWIPILRFPEPVA